MRRSHFPPSVLQHNEGSANKWTAARPAADFSTGYVTRTDFSAFSLVITAGTKLMNGEKKRKKKRRIIVTFWLNQVAAVFKEYEHVEARGGACGQQ